MAAAIKTAFEIFKGKDSIAYDIHAPPKSCPTKMTCINIKKQKDKASMIYIQEKEMFYYLVYKFRFKQKITQM
jgi:hypothetical protein